MNALDGIEIVVFDVDGTLTQQWTTHILPGRQEILTRLHTAKKRIFMATNQAGPAYQAWHTIIHSPMPIDYPDLITILSNMDNIRQQIGAEYCYVALHPGRQDIMDTLSKGMINTITRVAESHHGKIKSSHNPRWRKPQSGMLEAIIEDTGLHRSQYAYIGDQPGDGIAAKSAGMLWSYAEPFFDTLNEP